MNRKRILLFLGLGLALILACTSILAARQLAVGCQVDNLKFSKTLSPADQSYLGLKSSGPFGLRDIKARYVLIEVLNVYCPHCMEQAPALNRLYRLVESSGLKDRIKFVGVVSNGDAAVKRWRTSHKVPFPLVPDPEGEMAGALDITGTPTTVVVNKQGKVIVLHDGVFRDAEKAFKQLKAKLK